MRLCERCSKLCQVLVIGELLVDKNGAVDLRALGFRERAFLKTALGQLIACAVDSGSVLRAEQFNQLVIVAACRAARRKGGSPAMDAEGTLERRTGRNTLVDRMNESLEDARGALHDILQKQILQIEQTQSTLGSSGRPVLLLSEAAAEALAFC